MTPFAWAAVGLGALALLRRRPARRVVVVPGARVLSPFGVDRGDHVHQGVDLAAPEGTPIYAPVAGTVAGLWENGALSGAGNTVSLRTLDNRNALVFMHLRGWRAGLRVGARVRRGELVGYVGETDSSADNGRFTDRNAWHLHLEVLELARPDQAAHFSGTSPPRTEPLAWLHAHGAT